ncbi:unnamed protein product [Adineta steineri]|uniref:Nucleolar protein 10 n=1 Tax=Adineta steineri TaxID=433720 RepID=A0A818HSY3_9BILA|nr:unnamed protein product [Adineta steineri]
METLCSMLLGPKGNFGFNFVGRPDKNSKNEMRIHSRHLNDYMAVTCLQPGRVYSCPADNCTVVGFVRAETDYPSDCYVLRKPIQFTVTEHARWYHFNLPSGKSGYVDAENIFAKFLEATKLDLQNGYTGPTEFSTASDGDRYGWRGKCEECGKIWCIFVTQDGKSFSIPQCKHKPVTAICDMKPIADSKRLNNLQDYLVKKKLDKLLLKINLEKGERVYTFKKVDPAGNPTLSAHPAKFSPDDQYSRQRLKLKTRYRLLLTQTPLTKC